MIYKDAQMETFLRTEKELDKLINQMLGNYEQAKNQIISELMTIYGKFLTAVDTKDYYNLMIQQGRLNSLLTQVKGIYETYAKEAGIQIGDISSTSMVNTYYQQQYILTWFAGGTGIDLSFSMLDPRLVEFSVQGTQNYWKELAKEYANLIDYQPKYGTLSDLLDKNSLNDLYKIQQTITQGFIQGQNPREVADYIAEIFDTSQYNAERIARTEMTRTSNAGDYAAMEDAIDQGVECKRMWACVLDSHTRETHQQMDGQEVDPDEAFRSPDGGEAMYPGDFGDPAEDCYCRCTVIVEVNGVSPSARTGVNPLTGEPEAFEWQSYGDWMDSNGMQKNDAGKWVEK
jgi:SPP1 gp7 family putative phage head morphogenesis protein